MGANEKKAKEMLEYMERLEQLVRKALTIAESNADRLKILELLHVTNINEYKALAEAEFVKRCEKTQNICVKKPDGVLALIKADSWATVKSDEWQRVHPRKKGRGKKRGPRED